MVSAETTHFCYIFQGEPFHIMVVNVLTYSIKINSLHLTFRFYILYMHTAAFYNFFADQCQYGQYGGIHGKLGDSAAALVFITYGVELFPDFFIQILIFFRSEKK